uniref:Plasminogen activator inhibitor 1 RNA-binding protein n=1 Tax=Hadrurus spadix TaxID=141984 RepID=A0A1W7R9Y6_9SCOR
METTYGIGVKNRYELFCDDEDDPLEILRKQEEENRKLKLENLSKTNKGKGTKHAPVNKSTKDAPQKGKSNSESVGLNKPRLTKPGPDRSVRFSNSIQDESKDLEERRNRRNRDDRFFSDTREQKGDSEVRRRGGGGMRGARGGRGRGRGGMGFDNRGKREFDRQSGSDKSGVKPVEKREGAGAHNWGTVKDDLDVQLTPLSDENPEAGERSGDEVPFEQTETKEGESGNGVKSTSESSNEMTLDEWKKQQAGIRSKASFNLRKAGEGEDSNQWKKCYILKKKLNEDEEEEEEEEDSEDEDENSRRGRQKQYVDIKINFADSRRARGRGRGRGTGRGTSKGTKSAEQSVPKVDDWNDFPSLIAA